MVFTKKIVSFLQTGKINAYQLLQSYFLEDKDIPRVEELFLELTEKEKEIFVSEVWDKISESKQKTLVSILYLENWQKLINEYPDLKEQKQLKIIEILGYIPKKEVIDFLMAEMKNKKESIRLTASTALKKQDPALTLEPMLLALTKPDEWLPSRVYEVLKEAGSGLVPVILNMIQDADIKAQQVMVQLLGELGDATCLPILEKFASSPDKNLRKVVVEALKELKLKESWAILVRLMEDNEWQIRMQAVETIGLLGISEAISLLEQRKKVEQDSLVQECIDEALEKIEEASLPVTISWVRQG